MGKPKKNAEALRSMSINIRLTAAEKEQLDQAALLCNKPTTFIARQKLFKGKFPEPKIARIELDAYLELKKIGLSIGQLMRDANSGSVSTELLKLLTQLLNQQEIIINQIIYHDSQRENR